MDKKIILILCMLLFLPIVNAEIINVAGRLIDTEYPSKSSSNLYSVTFLLTGTPITNCQELQNIKNCLSCDYYLANDIDCSDTINWNGGQGFEPIGIYDYNYPEYSYSGIFDGAGNVIKNLYINRPSMDDVALFGSVTGDILNVGLVDVNITGHYTVGSLVAMFFDGDVRDSYSTGTVKGTDTEYGIVGGLVGYNSQQWISASYSTAKVYGIKSVGGLNGYLWYGRIKESYSIGDVSGNSYVGGLVGTSNGGIIDDSFYDMDNAVITGTGNTLGAIPWSDLVSVSYLTARGWDFVNDWNNSNDGIDYPLLLWQKEICDCILSTCCSDGCHYDAVGTPCGNNMYCNANQECILGCVPDCSNDSNVCIGDIFDDSCGGLCAGIKQPDCSAPSFVACGEPIVSNNECSGCSGTGTYCQKGDCINGICTLVPKQPKIKKITYDYDDYGNIIKTSFLGDVNKTGDERYEYTEYLYNTANWIVNKLKHSYTYDSDDKTKVKESWFSYDNRAYGNYPTKGDLTKREDWLNTGTNPVTQYSYNTYGNLISETDANSHTTSYIYGVRDTTYTFADKVKNAKNHETNYNYDSGTGNLLSETDPNGNIISYEYDSLGRKTKEILPYDSITYPTVELSYDFDGIPPEMVKVMQREENGTINTLDEYYFYDGLGRLIQTKTEAENSLISQDTYYDENGRIKKQSNPYFKQGTEYTMPESVKSIDYVYDALDRVINATNPDGTKRIRIYDHWTASFYDENGHRTDNIMDSYNQVEQVKEYNKGEIYTTNYNYDALGNLIEITDDKSNSIVYDYNSLGRKIKMNDPDLGKWNYSYDGVGNLKQQTDGSGISVYLQYDEIDRIKNKSSGSETIDYVYDTNKTGTLYSVSTPESTKRYYYDNRLRKTQKDTIIDGITFSTSYTYDSLDRIKTETLPDSEIVEYTYNNQGLLETVGGMLSNIDYNELGKPISRFYINSLHSDFTYNPDNFRLVNINTHDRQNLSYSYDNVGNVLEINDIKNNFVSSMQYDDLDRLVHAEKTEEYDITYDYNSIGNMMELKSDDYNLTFSYNNPVHAPNRIVKEESKICEDGETKLCPLQEGVCFDSFQTCQSNRWLDCDYTSIPGYEPVEESCDGKDNNCNGQKDEGEVCMIYHWLNLKKGWNLISFPMNLTNNSINSVFDTELSVFSYNNSNKKWLFYIDEFNNNFKEIDWKMGLWVNSPEDKTISVRVYPFEYPVTLPLYKGWNLVGYPSLNSTLINETLKDMNYSAVYGYDNGWSSYVPSREENSLEYFNPGYGYWVYS